MIFLFDIAFVGLTAVSSIALGWWLRGSGESQRGGGEQDRARAQEVLARLHDLAARVAADVGEHSSRVEEINEELTSVGGSELETDAVLSAVGKLVAANGRMQQQLASAEQRLQEQAQQIKSTASEARTDVLTGLANRRALDDLTTRLFEEFEHAGTTFSAVMIDIDHFKKFNDAHGHQAGDEVLRRVGGVLRQNKSGDAAPTRYGGEEFAVILPGVSVAGAVEEAERLRKAIAAARFRFGGTEFHVTASAGAAEIIRGEDVVTLIRRADTSLYASKAAGRNRTYWHDGSQSWPAGESAAQPLTSETPSPVEEAASVAPTTQRPLEAVTPGVVPPRAAAEAQASLCDGDAYCTVLNSRLAEWRRGGEAPSVLLVHIDRYASVVSKHGEATGKRAYHATVQFLRAVIRDMDLVAQYEDTTFALLLPGAGLDNAVNIAERLRQAIARCSLPVGDQRVQYSVSIGGAEASGGDDTPRLLQRAEEALSAAVESGGDCSYFHDGQRPKAVSGMLEKNAVV